VLSLRQFKSQPGAVLRQNTSASLIDMGDRVGLVEFHSKANSLDQDIFDMLAWSLDEAETGRFEALVLGNEGQHFCAGANVFVLWMASQQGDFEQVDRLVRGMQSGLLRMRYFPRPIVAAPFGMTLGGGAELVMSCSRRVAAAETFIGLVEVGVGLVPAGSGCKEMLRRIVNPVMRIPDAAFVALGFGPWYERLRARDADPRFAGRHVTLPAVPPDDVREWVAGADAVVIAVPGDSLNQRLSTPNKFWEGLTAGVPLVVGKDLPVMRRIVEEHDLGAIADPRDPDDLAAALAAVLDAPPDARAARRARALALARDRYRWDIEARDYLALVARLAPHAGASPP